MKNWCGYSVIRHHGVVIPCILCCQIGELVIYDIKLKSSYLNNCQVLYLYGRLDWFALVHDGKPKGHGGQLNSDFSFITGENIERIPEKQPKEIQQNYHLNGQSLSHIKFHTALIMIDEMWSMENLLMCPILK